jgi:DNA (cytosine-5)-methyltransferase 1
VTPTVGSLFSGIGGIDLGLERAGMEVRWQSEIDPYCCRVLAKYWPDTPNLGDVKLIDWSQVERVDVICGGYPCQPFSVAGRQLGDQDPRHLWPYFADAIRVLRPRLALLENVPGHLGLGFDRVLGDLAEIGFDADWDCIPAAAVGAPHLRDRVFVVAYPQRDELREQPVTISGSGGQGVVGDDGPPRSLADTSGRGGSDFAHSRDTAGQPLRPIAGSSGRTRSGDPAEGDRLPRRSAGIVAGDVDTTDHSAGASRRSGWWDVEPDVGRVAHGVPHRVDRLRGLGNAVVPQVAEHIGRQLLEHLR